MCLFSQKFDVCSKVRDELCRGNSHCNESPRWTFGRQPPSTVAPEQKTRWQSSGGSAFDSGTVSFAVMVAGAELPGAPRRTPAFFSFKWNNSGSWIEAGIMGNNINAAFRLCAR